MTQRSLRFSKNAWAIVVILGLSLLSVAGFLTPVQKLVVRVLAPVGRVAHQLVDGTNFAFQDRRTSADLKTENAQLKERTIALELERAALNQQLAELTILRSEQAFLDRRSLKGTGVRVIGRSQTSSQRVLIDGGTDQRVSRGAPVLAGDGVLVGVVEDVQQTTATVRLLTADTTSIAVRVRDQAGPPGVIVGERGVGMRLTLVPQNEKLEKGQAVITADADPQIPSGILVGTLSTIDAEPGALFQSASILQILPLDRLNVLTVLTSA